MVRARNLSRYNILIKALFENCEVNKAVSLWEHLKSGGELEPDPVSYGIFIHGLCRNGYVGKALLALNEAETEEESHGRSKLDVFAYSSMINGLCKGDRLDEAVAFFDRMAGRGGSCTPNSHIYNTLIDGFCRASKLEQAIQIFDEMIRAGCSPTMVTHNILISRFCKAERFEETSSFAKAMMEKGLKPDMMTYSALIDESRERGRERA